MVDQVDSLELIETSGDYQRLDEWWKTTTVTVRAWFTDGRRRRRLLSAWWGPGPRLPWIMLNPSLAGSGSYADNMDPTVRRVRSFTAAAGFDGFDVLNLYDLVDPDPAGLALEDPAELGGNQDWLAEAAHGGTPVVVAWGAHPKAVARAQEVWRQILAPSGAELLALVTTKAGHPGHPLYVKGTAKLKPWGPPWPR